MSRRLRWWMWALAAALLLLVMIGIGSWVAVQRYGPAFTRERIEAGLAGALDRPVRVERVQLQPWLTRLVVDGVAVAAGDTWDTGTVVQVGRATVRVGISSLWRREIVLSRVHFEDVVVDYTATGGDEPAEIPATIPESIDLGPVRAFIATVSLEGGRVRYRDPRRERLIEIDALEATARPAGGGLDATAEARVVTATTPALTETVESVRAEVELRGDHLTIERVQARWRGEAIQVTGEV
ncbi:MAG: hypothetical protein ACREJG_01220, partial [Candidatus Rokuibacteriota bacterium]